LLSRLTTVITGSMPTNLVFGESEALIDSISVAGSNGLPATALMRFTIDTSPPAATMPDHPRRTGFATRTKRRAAQRGIGLRHLVKRPCSGQFAIEIPQDAKARLAQPHCFFEHRVEHWGEIAGRGIDDLEHVGGRGLLGNGFVTLGSALGKLASQIGDNPLRVGQRTVWWCFHGQTFSRPCCCSIIR
jgi:hypothetical protein